MEILPNELRAWLAVDAQPTDTRLIVAAPLGTPGGEFRIRVEDELMHVLRVEDEGRIWIVERGIEGTTPDLHVAAQPVYPVITAGAIRDYVAEHAFGVNIRRYALSVGASDDTKKLQDAVSDCALRGGGILHLPGGEYRISMPITVSSGVRIVGEGPTSTRISVAGGDAFLFDGCDSVSVEGLSVRGAGKQANAEGFAFRFARGNSNNVSLRNIHCRGLGGAVVVQPKAMLTHFEASFCQFAYNHATHVQYEDGAIVNSVLFISTRFEQNWPGTSAFKAWGDSYATGNTRFMNCVFEGMIATRAVDLGNNPFGYTFIGCHFEANGIDTTDACDIYVGGGKGCVLIEGCMFSGPGHKSSNFTAIRKAKDSSVPVTVMSNMFMAKRSDAYRGDFSDASSFITLGNTTST